MLRIKNKLVVNALGKFDNPNYNPEAGMKYLATHFEMFKPEVVKAMIEDAKRKGVKIPPVVEEKARKAGIMNSVRNAKFKVGDVVEVVGDDLATKGKRGLIYKIDEANKAYPYKVRIGTDYNNMYGDAELRKVRNNSVRSTNSVVARAMAMNGAPKVG